MPLPRTRLLSALVAPTLLAVAVTGCGSSKDAAAKPTPTLAPHVPGANASDSSSAVDAAFVREMIPHHELAVSMASIAKHRAKTHQIQTLASDIVSAQKREITEMTADAKRLGVNTANAKSSMTTDAQVLGLSPMSLGMSMDLSALRHAKDFDKTFLTMMIPHHAGAVMMARVELTKGHDAKLRQLAQQIVIEQNAQVAQMAKLVAKS